MKYKALMLWSLLGFVLLAMLTGIAAVLIPSLSMNDEVLVTIILVGAYALGGLVVVAVSGRMRWTMRLCSACLIVSLVFFLFGVWFERSMPWRMENAIWITGTVSLIAGITLAQWMLIYPLKLTTPLGKIIKYSAMLFGALTGMVLIVGFISHGFNGWGRLWPRVMGVCAIMAGGASIGTIAMVLFGPKPEDDEPGLLGGRIPISLSCPRCNQGLTIDSNREGRCSKCRLKVRVEIEEPRCSCGYLLYELESDTCPECGKAVREADRWTRV